jgi:glutathione synthase/RimK-type ligase-like ATP-grasp enzyme
VTIVFATCSDQPHITADDERLADALRGLGHTVLPDPWTEIDPFAVVGADPVILRSTWDYHRIPTLFAAWLEALAESTRIVLNPPSIARANIDKVYLKALGAAGIAVPQTHWVDHPTPDSLAQLLCGLEWPLAVLKPRIGATAHGTILVARDGAVTEDDLAAARSSGAMVQEFIPEIRERGEISLVYAGRQFSHGVIKRPKPGDFRVQKDFGGTVEALAPSRAVLDFGASVMAHVPESATYARVDIVEGSRGPLLMELELIEPELFFSIVPEAAARMAEVIGRQID